MRLIFAEGVNKKCKIIFNDVYFEKNHDFFNLFL